MSKDVKGAAKTSVDDGDVVPRNEFGGVYVDEEELRAAFDFFDVHKKGTLVSFLIGTQYYRCMDCCGQCWMPCSTVAF